MPKLAESEIKSISLWILVMVAVIGGLFAGFLGGARLRAHAVAGVRARRPANSLGVLTFAASGGAALVVYGLVTGHQMK